MPKRFAVRDLASVVIREPVDGRDAAMSDEVVRQPDQSIPPALTPDLWARLRRHTDHASFACIILEGGYDAELGIDPSSSAFAEDDARRADAARAVTNDALPDSDPRKITREDVAYVSKLIEDFVRGYYHSPEKEALALRIPAKLAALLPPE